MLSLVEEYTPIFNKFILLWLLQDTSWECQQQMRSNYSSFVSFIKI